MEGKSILHCYCFTSELEPDMLTCIECKKRFHQSCLKKGRPSPLVGDIYFNFTCQNCSLTGMEIIKRKKLQWILVIMIALYNLQLKGNGKYGYFRWREHICRFIDQNWAVLFGEDRGKSATWHGTVAGALSNGANRFFVSGVKELGENGWWSLKYNKLPSLDELDSVALNFKSSRALKCQVPSEADILPVGEGSRTKNAEAVAALKKEKACITSNLKSPKPKKRRLESKKAIDSSNLSFQHKLKFVVSQPDVLNSTNLKEENSKQSVPKIIIKRGKECLPTYPNDLNMWMEEPQQKINLNNKVPINEYDLSNSLDDSINLPSVIDQIIADMNGKKEYESEEENSNSSKTVDTANNFHLDTTYKLKVVTKDENLIKKVVTPEANLKLMSPFEEDQLLEKLKNYSTAMKEKPEIRRLYRKLVVRKLKRERNLQVFDIDVKVRSLKGMDPPHYLEHEKSHKKAVLEPKLETILDRFQIGYSNALGKPQQHISFKARLMGLDSERETSFVSPYTERILKPFIYRNYNIKPLKMQLLEEVLQKTNKNNPNWIPPKQSPIDYRYVRPQYIPCINALCHKFFWPGIDMSECLQYPDFSCVALYKKLIIGFAFMVPDVKYNEAYVTFLFCHPEWRRSGIGGYMLYHLIQTCMGKDVTLHVSASSAAVSLYQEMGFEVEEVINDFYDKYLPPDSTECRHALFLRLSR